MSRLVIVHDVGKKINLVRVETAVDVAYIRLYIYYSTPVRFLGWPLCPEKWFARCSRIVLSGRVAQQQQQKERIKTCEQNGNGDITHRREKRVKKHVRRLRPVR